MKNVNMETFLKRIPPIELSYESKHMKVPLPSDYKIALAIPRSRKSIAWFTFYESTNICYILELSREKKLNNVSSYTTTNFDTEIDRPNLSLGTIFYGSVIPSGNFVIEDLLMYRGNSMRKIPFGEKLGFLKNIFETSFKKNIKKDEFPEFTLPVMWNINKPTPMEKISYTIHHIQYRPLNVLIPFINVEQNTNPWSNKGYCIKSPSPPPYKPSPPPYKPPSVSLSYKSHLPHQIKPSPINKIVNKSTIINNYTMFWVTADIQNDIYHLSRDNGDYIDIVYIPNYNTSVYMNSIFRNIRENSNLDLIEESDDEEDFQDVRLDKYVDLSKKMRLSFSYNKKFRKWVPLI